jgi:type IV secretion system protein VirB4
MMPLSAVWAGPQRNEHLNGPPLLFAKTEGATPFRLSLHTLVVGPTGAGKSVLLALLALQFRRYPSARIFAFDFGGSIRAATGTTSAERCRMTLWSRSQRCGRTRLGGPIRDSHHESASHHRA